MNNKEIGDPFDPVDRAASTHKIGGSSNTQTSGTSKSKKSKSPEVQTSGNPDTQEFDSPNNYISSSNREVRKSSSPTVQQLDRPKRTQQTIYLSPDIAKWLRIRAIEEEREISEIAEDALNTYKRLHE